MKFDRDDEIIYYSRFIQDYERLFSYYIQKKEYKKCLDEISNIEFQKSEKYIYKYCNTLFFDLPKETVQLWMKNEKLNSKYIILLLGGYENGEYKVFTRI